MTPDDIRHALASVIEPALHLGLVEAGLVRNIEVARRGKVVVEIGQVVENHPRAEELVRRVTDAVSALDGDREVDVRLVPVPDDEATALAERITAAGPGIPLGGRPSKTRVLLIASGKGGVGKSSVSVNLALSLARRGREVAIVDADVWGFSIPPMLGVERPPVVLGDRLVLPPVAHGVACASIGFLVAEDEPVIWRGPMLHKALEQFLTDFHWGEPDYLVVDLPPGTGDIALSLTTFLPRSEGYIVTTPQPAAQRVAQRAGLMFQHERIRIPVVAVIENMSWFTGDDGRRYELFGAGGGAVLAERLEVPLIGQVPLVPELREGGDRGDPIVVAHPDSEAAQIFATIAQTIDQDLAPTRRDHPGLKVS